METHTHTDAYPQVATYTSAPRSDLEVRLLHTPCLLVALVAADGTEAHATAGAGVRAKVAAHRAELAGRL